MHPFFIMGAIHHAIVLVVIAFFVLFTASKAEGFVKILGTVLGYLFLVCAVLWIVCAVTAPMFGGHPFGMTFGDGHMGMGYHWGHMQPTPTQPPPAHP